MILTTILELILVTFTIYCLFNEDKLIKFEDKIKEGFRK